MLARDFNSEIFGNIIPHMENILQCGFFSYSNNKTYCSEGVYLILGIELYSIENSFENFSKYIVAEDRSAVIAAIKRSRDTGIAFKIEFSILNAKGIYKRIYAENIIIPDISGKIIECSGVIKDITESYFYKKAIEQKVKQLDKSNQNLQEFVYVASHDLQEPLRKINTFIDRLTSKFENVLGQEGNMYIRRIKTSGKGMQTLLEDLLNFSRLSFHNKEFEKTPIKECLDSVISDLEIKIEETRTTIVSNQLGEIEAYPSQIKQLLNNLISNAIKFRKPGVRPVIKIMYDEVKQGSYFALPLLKECEYVQLVMQDNGIGFEQECSERIFMLFQRLNGKTEYTGSGIGLAICKKIVENLHGFIFANSSPGNGATFTVLLPKNQS